MFFSLEVVALGTTFCCLASMLTSGLGLFRLLEELKPIHRALIPIEWTHSSHQEVNYHLRWVISGLKMVENYHENRKLGCLVNLKKQNLFY